MFRKIKEGEFHFNHQEFKEVSEECKDLITHLLVCNDKKRLTGVQALKHAWFTKFDGKSTDDAFNSNVLSRLKSYKGVSHLKRAAMNMLVKMASEDEVRELKLTF